MKSGSGQGPALMSKPSLMARPRSISNERILDAAREVFLEKGVTASTAQIAARAGISEGSIFKRYISKEQLFQESMGIQGLDLSGRLESRIGNGNLEKHLNEIVVELIDFFRDLLPRMMMLCTQPGFDPLSIQRGASEPPPIKLMKQVGAYIAAERRLRRLDCKDPEIVARVLIASAHNFVFLELIRMSPQENAPARKFARNLIGELWGGIAPKPERSKRPPPSPVAKVAKRRARVTR
jgi:AcrR family transcriptional regulator